jgi:hypothetical protein
MPSYVVEYDADSREVARRAVPPRPVATPSFGQELFGLATSPAEATIVAGATWDALTSARQGLRPLFFFHIVPTQLFVPGAGADVATWGGAVVVYRGLILLSALACGLVCFVLARRYSLSRSERLAWWVRLDLRPGRVATNARSARVARAGRLSQVPKAPRGHA